MKRRHAFTLVELLVVIAVIALLIAILLPSLARAKKQARSAICLVNVRALAQATRIYVQEWDKIITGGGHSGVYGVFDYQLFGGDLPKTTYYNNNHGRRDSIDKVRWCPETQVVGDRVTGTATTQWNCESKYPNSTGSYGFNGWLYDPHDSAAAKLAGSTWVQSSVFTFRRITSESAVPMFSDANWHDFWPTPADAAPASLQDPGPTSISGSAAAGLDRACMDRHSRAVNVSFVDGHAEHVKLGELWDLQWSATWNRSAPMRLRN
jgi:prepilin-type N-terminal cleavage/methylation domain-containing protein/prepilin-type processing-associated H-X9-DG protein